MGVKLKAMGIASLDKTKADPRVRHKYVLKCTFNEGIPDKDKAYVICDHILASEGERYITMTQDGSTLIDFSQLFKSKVKEIHGIDHPVEERELTVDELLNSYGSSMAKSIINDVAIHLVRASSLTDDEIKN